MERLGDHYKKTGITVNALRLWAVLFLAAGVLGRGVIQKHILGFSGMGMQQIELLQEEVYCQHQIDNDAQNDELAAGDVHQVLNVVVIDVGSMTSLLLSVRVKRRFDSLLARSSHSSDH